MQRNFSIRSFSVRISSFLLAIVMILSLSSCQFSGKSADDADALLVLPEGYLSPIEAQWASVFLPQEMPDKTQTQAAFQSAWNNQINYLLDRMQAVNAQGHLFYAELLKTAEFLVGVSENAEDAARQVVADYTNALLQADVSASLVQSGKIKDKSEQAIMSYNWLLASANLAGQSTAATNDLISLVLDENNGLSQEDFTAFENGFVNVLAIHNSMLEASRQMVEAHAKLQIADQVLGNLLDGAVLAETALVRDEDGSAVG